MNFYCHAGIRYWILRRKLCRDRIHCPRGLAFAHARPQPRDNSTWMRSAVVDEATVAIGSNHRQEKIVVPIVAAVEIEVRGKNADDSPARAVEIDRATNHRRIGIETSFPQSIAHHEDARRARFVFIFAEDAADLRLHLQRCKETCSHVPAESSFGL